MLIGTERIELGSGEYVLGRSSQCRVVVDDALASRQHALLVVASEGVTVEDLGSRNGLRLNGEVVAGSVALQAGDSLRIGSTIIQIEDADATAEDLPAWDALEELPTAEEVLDEEDDRGSVTEVTAQALLPELEAQLEQHALDLEAQATSALIKDTARYAALPSILTRFAARMRGTKRQLESGTPPELEQLEETLRAALCVSSESGDHGWFEQAAELIAMCDGLFSVSLLASLEAALEHVPVGDTLFLQQHLARLEAKAPYFSPGDRFKLKRTQALARRFHAVSA